MAKANATAAVVVFPIIRMEFPPVMRLWAPSTTRFQNVLSRREFLMFEMKTDNLSKRRESR